MGKAMFTSSVGQGGFANLGDSSLPLAIFLTEIKVFFHPSPELSLYK